MSTVSVPYGCVGLKCRWARGRVGACGRVFYFFSFSLHLVFLFAVFACNLLCGGQVVICWLKTTPWGALCRVDTRVVLLCRVPIGIFCTCAKLVFFFCAVVIVVVVLLCFCELMCPWSQMIQNYEYHGVRAFRGLWLHILRR